MRLAGFRHGEQGGLFVTAGALQGGGDFAPACALDLGLSKSLSIQHFADVAHSQNGVIAIITQMAEHDVMKSRVGEVVDEFRGLLIGQMAVMTADALFDRPRPFGIGIQQFGVVIGLHKETIGTGQAVANQIGHMTDVAEEAEA